MSFMFETMKETSGAPLTSKGSAFKMDKAIPIVTSNNEIA